MSSSGGIGQLIKGLIMGMVLILAIIGGMTIFEKEDTDSSTQQTATNTADSNTTDVKAPEINIASQTPLEPTKPDTAEESTEKEAEDNSETSDTFKPMLEGEKTAEVIKAESDAEKKPEPMKYGLLKLSTINPDNKENLKANYVVFDSNNIKVAASNNSDSTSYRLPVGSYKVITTLVKPTDGSTRNSKPVQSTQTITVTADNTSDEVFELEPPLTIGVLQVSAKNAKNKQSMKANFIVQKENGETVASRQNVTRSLFKLKAGSYKVTVRNGNNSDFRTVVVEPGESTNEVFNLQESFLQGKVLVRIFDTRSSKPVRADIVISTRNGQTIQALKSVSQTEIALAEGNYKIRVTGPNGQSNKNITVVAGRSISEIFRFDAPPENQETSTTNNTNNEIEQEFEQEITKQQNDSSLGKIKLFARNATDQKPLKSNFYVQTPNGKHLNKKIYSDTAEFSLEPGTYRITVRSKNRSNIVRTLQVIANQSISEVFSMQKNSSSTANKKQSNTKQTPTLAPPKPAKAIPNGFLNVSMRPAKKTHFIIANRKGKKIVELTSVPSGSFKLDAGVYIVTAIYNNQRRKQTIQIHRGKTTRLNFNADDFQTRKNRNNSIPKGVLRSRIVDTAGRPLRGDLTVTNSQGQVVARANGVTVGLFNLSPASHTVIVNYQGLKGSERVNIVAGETTVQTFTITPDQRAPQTQQPAPVKQPRSSKEILRDKIEEELRRIF